MIVQPACHPIFTRLLLLSDSLPDRTLGRPVAKIQVNRWSHTGRYESLGAHILDMYTADALSRTLQSRISLLMLAIFLLLTACHGFLNSRYDSTKHAAVSRQLFVNDSHALGVSTERGPPLSIPLLNHNATFSSLLVKRFSKDDFERYVKHGDTAYNTMQRSFTRGIWSECDSPVQDFRPQDFRNGWSGTDGNQLPPGGLWETVFDRLLGKRPTTEQSFRVEVEQTRPFTNRQGQLVPAPVLQVHSLIQSPNDPRDN